MSFERKQIPVEPMRWRCGHGGPLWGMLVTALLVGCSQDPGAGVAADPYSTSGSPSAAYIADLQRRAHAQSKLAYEQRRQLEYMRMQQQRADAQLLALKQQQESAAADGQSDDGQLASQALEAMERYDELGRRATGLDQSNRNLYAELAQAQQRLQLLEDQNRLMRQRLQETSDQLTEAMRTSEDATSKYEALLTSTQRRSGASITANNSYRRNLTAVTIQGLNVRQDGDLVRIEIPSDRLFEADGATIRGDAKGLIDQAANVILKHYPQQVVGIEAHADNSPVTERGWRSSHQMTAAQAMSVFEALSERHPVLSDQMFVLGHGDNYPMVSNSTVAGQARNRRLEVVIYPETSGRIP